MSEKIREFDTTIFQEEIKKRVTVPEGHFEKFLDLWEYKKFARNEFILKAGEIPKFTIFVLKGCLRQYIVNEKGEESIVYFAEERHFIGDLPALRNQSITSYNFQAIEACTLLTINAENWEKASVQFSWWTEAHLIGFQRWAALLQQQIAERHTLTADERYLNLLKAKPGLFQRVPQHFIASYLGISPETISRIRKRIFNN